MNSMKFKHYKYLPYNFFTTKIFPTYCLCLGIFSSVLSYILRYKDSSWNGHENLIGMSMKLLQAIARSNAQVSIYMYVV